MSPRTHHYNPNEMYLSIRSLKTQGKETRTAEKLGGLQEGRVGSETDRAGHVLVPDPVPAAIQCHHH